MTSPSFEAADFAESGRDHPFQFRSSCLGALRGDSLLFRLKVSRHFTPLLGEMAIRALRLKIGRYGCCVLTLLRFLTTFLRPIGHH
jgi:hypothetical protein